MLLFDLAEFDKDQMITYLKTMAAIAAADGNIHASETAYFNHMMELFNIPESSRMFIRQNLKNPPALGPLLKELTDRKMKNQIIRDAYLMAYIDEEMHPDESEALNTIVNIFKLDEAQVELISRWAEKGHDWRKEGYSLSILD
jgi:uncharacterized tellurite resistance protein B-like protein